MRKKVYKIVDSARESIMIIPTNSVDYCLKYLKGSETKALSGTLGIFCFRRKIDAINFMSGSWNHTYSIIRVAPLGKGKKPKLISGCVSSSKLDSFYKGIGSKISAPEGTICYPSVLVLE